MFFSVSAFAPDRQVSVQPEPRRKDPLIAGTNVVRSAAAYRPTRRTECAPSVVQYAPGCEVGVPYRMMVHPGDGYVQYVHMPKDERTEPLCRRMIQRPEDLWTMPAANSSRSYEPPDSVKLALVREQGVRCLSSFRSQANIEILKSVAQEGPSPSPPDYRGPRFDPSAAATLTLASWGFAVQ